VFRRARYDDSRPRCVRTRNPFLTRREHTSQFHGERNRLTQASSHAKNSTGQCQSGASSDSANPNRVICFLASPPMATLPYLHTSSLDSTRTSKGTKGKKMLSVQQFRCGGHWHWGNVQCLGFLSRCSVLFFLGSVSLALSRTDNTRCSFILSRLNRIFGLGVVAAATYKNTNLPGFS